MTRERQSHHFVFESFCLHAITLELEWIGYNMEIPVTIFGALLPLESLWCFLTSGFCTTVLLLTSNHLVCVLPMQIIFDGEKKFYILLDTYTIGFARGWLTVPQERECLTGFYLHFMETITAYRLSSVSLEKYNRDPWEKS